MWKNLYLVKLGAIDGTSKTSKGGIKQIKAMPKEIPIFDIDQSNGKINAFADVDKFMSVRKKISLHSEKNNRFILSVNGMATRFEDYFKRAVVSAKPIRRVLQTAAKSDVVGFGESDSIVTHGLPETSTQMMVDACVPDSAISKKSGQKCLVLDLIKIF